jgi:hypothetical protein
VHGHWPPAVLIDLVAADVEFQVTGPLPTGGF